MDREPEAYGFWLSLLIMLAWLLLGCATPAWMQHSPERFIPDGMGGYYRIPES